MEIVFVSNFFNHHQKSLSESFAAQADVTYTFIETKPISEERLKLGWGRDEKPHYVKNNYTSDESKDECQRLIDKADIVIFGDAPHHLLKNRLKEKKLTFLYHERIYKKGYAYHKIPFRMIRNFFLFTRHKNMHLLCASAYASADFAKTGCFIGKAYKWGYFTEFKKYDNIDSVISNKQKNSILWAARFLDWKHPEIPVEIAKRLKAQGYQFNMNLIGNGVMMNKIEELICENGLEDCVHLSGSMQPHQVRQYMENSEIFLFTSDRNEGWGAVANESMNSACAIVASHAIGSVPFLIDNGRNGLIYHDGNIDEAFNKIKWLLDNPEERVKLAQNAYATMKKEWNASVAVEKFLVIAKQLLCGKKVIPFSRGVCSKAERLQDNWIEKSE